MAQYDPNQYPVYAAGSQGSPEESRSPLSNIMKNIGGSSSAAQKQTKDGQPQKRRGPKPDSKPALTRRQELNRQAQRTHRERKEQYTKALESEVLRLKELFSNTTRERDAALADAHRLRDILKAHGIQFDLATPSTSYNASMPSYTGSNSGSVSGGYRQDSNTTAMSPSPLGSQSRSPMQMQSPHGTNQASGNRIDYDQLGMDFILTLERPCMDHMQYLVVRSHNNEGQPFHHPMERPDDSDFDHMSGHALMASCPPYSHVMDTPGESYPHQLPDLPKFDLMKLLEASSKLDTDDTEVTPVRAWMMILQNERRHLMTKRDFEIIQANLLAKVRCYGFGSVLEEFEVNDAIDSVFVGRNTVPAVAGIGSQVHNHQHAHTHVMA